MKAHNRADREDGSGSGPPALGGCDGLKECAHLRPEHHRQAVSVGVIGGIL